MSSALPNSVANFLACTSQDDLAAVLGTSTANLLFHLYSRKGPQYRTFTIPKASGAGRTVSVPPTQIAQWQARVHSILTELYIPKPGVHGFIPARSIRTNAERHVGRTLILNIDLESFFPSIHFGRVRGLFRKAPFDLPDTVAATLAQLCTNAGTLPQGAPTSPMISNFICRRLDNDLFRLAKKSACIYSRFADDITFSTARPTFPELLLESQDSYGAKVVLGSELLRLVEKHKFTVNGAKSRVRSSHRRQEVTGLTVNRKVNVPRHYIRRVRALIHNWEKNGQQSMETQFHAIDPGRKTRRGTPPSLSAHLQGKLEFMRMIRGRGDALHARYAIAASKLHGFGRAAILEGRATEILEFVREALWIVLGRDPAGHFGPQGTAFGLAGIGFVSARHVFDAGFPGFNIWRLVRAGHPYDEFPITGYRNHPNFDLTTLEVVARPDAEFRRTTDVPIEGDQVLVLGFPNWHTHADQPLRVVTSVVQRKTISGARLSSVNFPLLSGASGGPVLNREGCVVGVITNSVGSLVFPNSFLSLDHLETVTTAPVTSI
jgi:RNA-directed DNA polymerase